jgi:hypothetical protein
MAAITDSRFQHALLSTANLTGKLYDAPIKFRLSGRNTPDRLQSGLAPLHRDGTLPDYPLGSDFTPVEYRLFKALSLLKANSTTRGTKLKTIARALMRARRRRKISKRWGEWVTQTHQGLAKTLCSNLVALALRKTAG